MKLKGKRFTAISLSLFIDLQVFVFNRLKVWICVELSGGDSFRNEIVAAVKKCKVFLPLLNNAWALSGECEDEYSLAKRLNLTSHESMRTKRTERRLPIMMPVAFSDLAWTAHPHVELLAASTNFIVHQGVDLNEGPLNTTLSQIFVSLQGCGFEISGLPQHPKPRHAPAVGATATTVPAKVSVKSQIVEMHSMLQSITSTMQTLALSSLDEKISTVGSASREPVETAEHGLGKEYQGTIIAENALASGEKYAYCDSILLRLSHDPATNACTGTINADSIMKRVVGYDTPQEVPTQHVLHGWVNTDDHEVHDVKGTYNPANKMLSLFDVKSTGHVSNMSKYHLVLHGDRLVGVEQALHPRTDLEDPSVTKPLNLLCVR